jgi:hypothetical protein
LTRRRFRRDPTHALFADQSQSIPDNLVALFGRIGAWNYSAETARSAVGCSPRSGSETVASQAEHCCHPASRLRSFKSARSSSGVRFLRLTCRAADGPAQPEMTPSRSSNPRHRLQQMQPGMNSSPCGECSGSLDRRRVSANQPVKLYGRVGDFAASEVDCQFAFVK